VFVRLQIVVPTVAGAIVLVSACFVLVYRCRVAVFAKFNVHPFDVDECEGEDMAFDAFVSCAWPDDALAQQVVTASSTSSSQYIRRDLHWLPVCQSSHSPVPVLTAFHYLENTSYCSASLSLSINLPLPAIYVPLIQVENITQLCSLHQQ